MSKIDDLNIQPKFDNALQVQRTANIPDNEKYKASEWNALISKTNEVVGRANLNTWNIVTNYSELPTDPVNGQKVYVTGTGLNGHVSVQMMVNGKGSRGFYVYDAFSDLWVQKTSESELTSITFSIDTNWSGLPTEPTIGDIFELTTNDTPVPANVIGVIDPDETAGKYQFNGTNWVAKSDTVLYQEVLAMLEDKLDVDMNNLSGDLTEVEQDTIKSKLNISDGGELKKIGDGYGLQHQIDNPNNYGTLGFNAVNLSYSPEEGDYGATGDLSHAEGGRVLASGQASSASGMRTIASGLASNAEGYATTAGSYAENARGSFNEVITPINANSFNENDVIESVGVGADEPSRKNALTRWKNGAFKWLLQPLTNITNAVIGFHAADETGRLNYHNGTEWKKYALEGESGGGGIQNLGVETTQEDFQTMASGVYFSLDGNVLGHSNFDGFVKVSEWDSNHRTIEITGWFDSLDKFQSHYYWLDDNQDTTFTLTYGGNALEVDTIKEQNNQDDLRLWKGTQAEYDALPTKYSNTVYIDSNSNLIGSGGGSKKEFIGEYGNPHTTGIVIDTTQFNQGDEWIITYDGAALPTITLDGSKTANLIDVGVDFQANVVNRIYLHLVEISGTDYYFDVTATPITLL